MYGVERQDIATIEGRTPTASGGERASEQAALPGGRRRGADGASDESVLSQESRGEMRTVSKGGQPSMVARCLAQALANPYSFDWDFNRAMGYVPSSATGPHYLNTAILTGLLTEREPGWFRPTAAGRALVASGSETGSEASAGVWDALLALPAYRRYLEYKILTIIARNRARTETLALQAEAAAIDAYSDFHSRAESIRALLGLDTLTPSSAISALRDPPALEPVGRDAVHAWMVAQGLGRGRSDLSRAAEIARVLARAARIPLTVRGEWLEPAELLALLLLIAARQHGQGVVIGATGGLGASAPVARAVERLWRCGLDIRVEGHGGRMVVALVPAVALLLEAEAVAGLARIGAPELAPAIRAVTAALAAEARLGLDGIARGAVELEELAARLIEIEAALEGAGEFASAAAADAAEPVASTISIGPPLPLATGLPASGRAYTFLEDAVALQERRAPRGAIAALLSAWGAAQRRSPAEELARSPHLALLYLIVADMGDPAPTRRETGWTIGADPLASALDDRLRGLGYEVWDESYRADGERLRALGEALVEQGLSLGILTLGRAGGHALDAPSSKAYYPARGLLAIKPATRSAL